MGSYHVIEVAQGQRWILEPGACWASRGGAARSRARADVAEPLGRRRDFVVEVHAVGRGAGGDQRAWRGGDGGGGWLSYQVQGRLVLGRTDGLRFTSRSAARLISGRQRLRVYSGSRTLLVCAAPYWSEKLYSRVSVRSAG